MYFIDFFAYIVFQILQIYKYAVIIYVIISMLISFNVINYNNSLVSIIMDFLYRLTEPLLKIIRRIGYKIKDVHGNFSGTFSSKEYYLYF